MLDNLYRKPDKRARRGAKPIAAVLLLSVFVLFGVACGGGESAGGGQGSPDESAEKNAAAGARPR